MLCNILSLDKALVEASACKAETKQKISVRNFFK